MTDSTRVEITSIDISALNTDSPTALVHFALHGLGHGHRVSVVQLSIPFQGQTHEELIAAARSSLSESLRIVVKHLNKHGP